MKTPSLAILALSLAAGVAAGQADTAGPPSPMRQAAQLDRDGHTAQARRMFQAMIDSAADPAAKARAQRAMAMSYAFDRDCANAVKYEGLVIAYWVTREQAEPQDAFYQQGEMANEAARVCLDAGELDVAERWYRRGYELGTKGNERDSFQLCLLAMTLERLGRQDQAKTMYQKAYDLATSHNPPAAFVRPFARTKLGR
jgi:tetratricopeptide (TPR) repeat protein